MKMLMEMQPETRTATQSERILAYLKQGNSITPLYALDAFGCFRLGARISDLKRQGHNIVSQLVPRNGKYVAKYTLIPESTENALSSL